MKRIISLMLVAVMLFATAMVITGCGETAEPKTIASIDDLAGARIGVQLGTTGDVFYASQYEKDNGSVVERFSKGADAVLALTQDKVDCVIIDIEPAKEFVAQNEGLKILDEQFEAQEEYAICISKDNKDLTEDFNNALAELKDEGIVDQIFANFTDEDKKGTCPYTTPEGTEYPNGELHMATNAAFEPYEYVEGGEVVGIDPMLATAICDKLGYKLVIDDMEFDSIITAVNTGKADFGMAGMTVNEERLQEIDFTDSYTSATQVIIVKE